ncbi:MAG TPA: hypothetical protein VFA90_01920 [Terriglobales bacterium]|nr:hypothetical protein [Terriglobales bacterium]
MEKRKRNKRIKQEQRAALKLLCSRHFFNEFLAAMRKEGLVCEEPNALVLLIVVVSRLLPHPLHVFIKGRSSAGKNFLVRLLLRLLPKHVITEVTSVSDKAWNYLNRDFRHTVVYLQEENEAAGNIQPLRLLISEGRVVRLVATWEGKERVTKKYVARGPVSSISTTTRQRLTIDDENRHISIRLNESHDQTGRIIKAYARSSEGLTNAERRTWRMVHRLLEKRIGAEITFPEWFDKVADHVATIKDLRLRRYYPAFVDACRAVCLIRSFQKDRRR